MKLASDDILSVAVARNLEASVEAVARVSARIYIVLWKRLQNDVVEYGTHRAEETDGKIYLSGGDYYPAQIENVAGVDDAMKAARRDFAERAGFITGSES